MRRLTKSIVLAAVCLLPVLPSSAPAQDVTITSANGLVSLSGVLIDYDGEFYQIRTQFGEMTLNGLGAVCSGHGCPDPGEYASQLTLSGSRLAGEILTPALIESLGFLAAHTVEREQVGLDGHIFHISDRAGHPVARIDLAATTTAAGFADLIAGRTSMALASRVPTGEEVEQATFAELGDLSGASQKKILALDAFVIIVSSENPVTAITLEQARGVFSGKITNWSDLGGIDAPISVVTPGYTSDLTKLFLTSIGGNEPVVLTGNRNVFNNNAALSDAVAAEPFAIGLTNYPSIRNARALSIKGACGYAVAPTAFTIKTEDYPLTQHLYLYTNNKRKSVYARSLLAYLDSPQAQITIAEQGFVGQDISYLPLSSQGARLIAAVGETGGDTNLNDLQNMIRSLQGARRLSTTYRFKPFSASLDARSQINIDLLARAIEVGEFDGKELIIAGFSDSNGSAEGNRKISRQRAGQVKAGLQAAAIKADPTKVKLTAIGFGEISPLGCNNGLMGQRINRRVEVWVKD